MEYLKEVVREDYDNLAEHYREPQKLEYHFFSATGPDGKAHYGVQPVRAFPETNYASEMSVKSKDRGNIQLCPVSMLLAVPLIGPSAKSRVFTKKSRLHKASGILV